MSDNELNDYIVPNYTISRLRTMAHEMSIQQPWLDAIIHGVVVDGVAVVFKTVEGRVGVKGARDNMRGWLWWFYDPNDNLTRVRVRIGKIRHYPTLAEYIAGETWRTIAPHTGSNAAAAAAYEAIWAGDRQVFGADSVAAGGGINAIEFVRV